MRRKIINRKLAVGAILAMLSVVGLVYAAWTTNGSGSGYTKAGTAATLTTMDVSASTSATLYPGTSGDVLIKVANPNPYSVVVSGVSLNGTNADITPDGSHASCTTTGVSFTNQSGLSLNVPARSGGVDGTAQATLSGAASMSNASVNGCQGAVFTIPVTITGASG